MDSSSLERAYTGTYTTSTGDPSSGGLIDSLQHELYTPPSPRSPAEERALIESYRALEQERAQLRKMAEHAERYRWAEEFHGRFDNRPRPITRWKNPVGKQPQPKAEEVRVEIDDNYLELAEDIGLDSMCVLEEMLKACLKKEKIFVYPTDKAEKYLESKFTNSSQQVVWRPLRKQDINENYPSSTLVRMVYNRAVPGFALQKVKTISEAFTYPSELTFEVSDYEEVKPDPFLSVRIKGSEKRFVVAVWDEPNFRMEELAETTKEKGGEPEQDNSIA